MFDRSLHPAFYFFVQRPIILNTRQRPLITVTLVDRKFWLYKKPVPHMNLNLKCMTSVFDAKLIALKNRGLEFLEAKWPISLASDILL